MHKENGELCTRSSVKSWRLLKHVISKTKKLKPVTLPSPVRTVFISCKSIILSFFILQQFCSIASPYHASFSCLSLFHYLPFLIYYLISIVFPFTCRYLKFIQNLKNIFTAKYQYYYHLYISHKPHKNHTEIWYVPSLFAYLRKNNHTDVFYFRFVVL